MNRRSMEKILLIGTLLSLFSVPLVHGQDYPSKPIEFIVGFPPGGVSDSTSRVLCKVAEKILGQPLVIVNKPGVSQALALSHLVNQKPDGYTISYVAGGALIQVPFFEKVNYKKEDFSYIMGFGYGFHGLTVKGDAPWNTLREFLDYAKKNPGKVRYASFSPVSATSIMMYSMAAEEGIDWIHVPYKGDAPAITALLGGHVDAVASAGGQVPYIRSGKLKLLAVFNSYPSKSFRSVPTLKSLGYKFPMLSDFVTTQGVIAPRTINPEISRKLEDSFMKAAKDPSFINLMESLDSPIVYKTGKEFEAEITSSYQIGEKLLPPIAAKMKK